MSIGEFSEKINTEAPKLYTWSDFSLFGGAEGFDEGRGDKCKRSPRRTFATQEQGAGDRDVYPFPPQDPKDFLWLMTEEPHRTRRMAIMKAHPEVSVNKPATKFFLVYIRV
jgi:sphingolipid delta-4 desaturase